MTGKKIIAGTILTLFTLCLLQTVFGQDKVYVTTGKVLDGKVTEVGPKQIKMLMKGRNEGPVYIFNLRDIDSIVYANGAKEDLDGIRYERNLHTNIPELNTWTFDPMGFIFLSVSQSYERRLKNGKVGFRIPLYVGFSGGFIAGVGLFPRSDGPGLYDEVNHGFSIASGINPKFYFFKGRILRAFIGPELTIGYTKSVYDNYLYIYSNNYGYDQTEITRSVTLAGTCKFGLTINPVDQCNITLEGGVGFGDLFGRRQEPQLEEIWQFGLAIGTNFF